MKCLTVLLLAAMTLACSKSSPSSNIAKIEGTWHCTTGTLVATNEVTNYERGDLTFTFRSGGIVDVMESGTSSTGNYQLVGDSLIRTYAGTNYRQAMLISFPASNKLTMKGLNYNEMEQEISQWER